jgi:hypothetical protein
VIGRCRPCVTFLPNSLHVSLKMFWMCFKFFFFSEGAEIQSTRVWGIWQHCLVIYDFLLFFFGFRPFFLFNITTAAPKIPPPPFFCFYYDFSFSSSPFFSSNFFFFFWAQFSTVPCWWRGGSSLAPHLCVHIHHNAHWGRLRFYFRTMGYDRCK